MHTEHGETGEVDRRSPGFDIGRHPGDPAGAGLAATQEHGHEVAQLSFHLGPCAAVGVLPLGGSLLSLVRLEDRLMGMDIDAAPARRRGARRRQGQVAHNSPKLALPPPRQPSGSPRHGRPGS